MASAKEQLEAARQEYEQSLSSLEQNFAKNLVDFVDEELEELFFDNREEFFKRILTYQNEVFKDIQGKQENIKGLQAQSDLEDNLNQIDLARQKFQEEHPEFDVNILVDFYMNLPPEVKEKIAQLPPSEMFNALFELYNAQNANGADSEPSQEQETSESSQEKETNDLPKQVNGAPSPAAVSEPELDLPTSRM